MAEGQNEARNRTIAALAKEVDKLAGIVKQITPLILAKENGTKVMQTRQRVIPLPPAPSTTAAFIYSKTVTISENPLPDVSTRTISPSTIVTKKVQEQRHRGQTKRAAPISGHSTDRLRIR